jgi:hypothetical protein
MEAVSLISREKLGAQYYHPQGQQPGSLVEGAPTASRCGHVQRNNQYQHSSTWQKRTFNEEPRVGFSPTASYRGLRHHSALTLSLALKCVCVRSRWAPTRCTHLPLRQRMRYMGDRIIQADLIRCCMVTVCFERLLLCSVSYMQLTI